MFGKLNSVVSVRQLFHKCGQCNMSRHMVLDFFPEFFPPKPLLDKVFGNQTRFASRPVPSIIINLHPHCRSFATKFPVSKCIDSTSGNRSPIRINGVLSNSPTE